MLEFLQVEIGFKGSGVWLRADEVAAALASAKNFLKFPDKAYFRKLIIAALGKEKLQNMAIHNHGATNIPARLFRAVEGKVCDTGK